MWHTRCGRGGPRGLFSYDCFGFLVTNKIFDQRYLRIIIDINNSVALYRRELDILVGAVCWGLSHRGRRAQCYDKYSALVSVIVQSTAHVWWLACTWWRRSWQTSRLATNWSTCRERRVQRKTTRGYATTCTFSKNGNHSIVATLVPKGTASVVRFILLLLRWGLLCPTCASQQRPFIFQSNLWVVQLCTRSRRTLLLPSRVAMDGIAKAR